MQAVISDFNSEETLKLTPQPWWNESMAYHINQLREALLIEFCEYNKQLTQSLKHHPTRTELLCHLTEHRWDQDSSCHIHNLVRDNLDLFMSMMNKTECRNIRDGTFDPGNPDHVYIGRVAKFRGRWLKQSIFVNPFKVKNHTQEEHIRVVTEFAASFMMNADLKKQVQEKLQGKTLYCWCKPLPCHGAFLAAWLNDEPVEKLLPEVHV